MSLFASLVCARASQAQAIHTIARVLATSDVGGRFASPACEGALNLRPAETARFTSDLVREASASDRPLAIDLGGLLVPHGVARYSAEHEPRALAQLVAALGYRALALGQDDLGAPRQSMLAVLRELRELRVPMVATNLVCAESASALCEVLVDASDGVSMHIVDERRVAVLAMLDPRVLPHLAPESAEGLELQPPNEALPRAVRRAREAGAQIVIVVMATSHTPDRTDAALELARDLEDDARPDLMLVGGAGGELLFARPAGFTPALVAAPRGGVVEVRVRESDELARGYEMLAQPLASSDDEVAEPVQDWIDTIGEAYCAEWGRALPGGRLEEPLDADGMAELAARVVRHRTGADVAILNRGAINQSWRPAHADRLTASDVYVALEYDEPLVAAEVPETWLRALAERSEDADVVAAGLHQSGDEWQVAGQAFASGARYRVVTIGYLARGGDDALPELPRGVEWSAVQGHSTLRSAVLAHLEQPDERDARQTVRHPERSTQWLLRASVDGTFSGTTVENSAGYELGQLNLFEFFGFGVEANIYAEARDPTWSFDNALYVLYRTTWLPGDGTAGAFIEPADIIRFRSTLAWTGLRQDADQLYVPDLYVEGFVETELTPPAPEVRPFHSLYVRPTVGARFTLLPELALKIAFGLQSQVLDPNSGLEPGIGAVVTLQPLELLRLDERLLSVEAIADYFVSDLGGVNRQQLRANANVVFDLAGPFKLTLSFNFFLQNDDTRNEVGLYLSATAGLRVSFVGRAVP